MENQGIRTPLVRLQTGGIVAGLLSIGAVVALTAGMPSVAAVSPAPTFPPEVSANEPVPRFRRRCEECAVVTSIREVEPFEHGSHSAAGSRTTKGVGKVMTGESARRYEVTVQMRNGSTRVFEQVRTTNWRVNERLILIGGSSISNGPKAILATAGDAG